MKTLILAGAALAALLALANPASAADPGNGQMLFRAQCGVCHMAGEGDGDGSQGPSLKGVIGRKVGGDPAFGTYTDALLNDKDIWTQQSLANFIADPQKGIPGTAMPVKVDSPQDRADIAAYLATVKGAP
jgi:cytochrome c2